MKNKEYFLHKLEAITWLREAISNSYGDEVNKSGKYLECTELVNSIEKELLNDYKNYRRERKDV